MIKCILAYLGFAILEDGRPNFDDDLRRLRLAHDPTKIEWCEESSASAWVKLGMKDFGLFPHGFRESVRDMFYDIPL